MSTNLLEAHPTWFFQPTIFSNVLDKFDSKFSQGSLSGLAITSRTGEINNGFEFGLGMHSLNGYCMDFARKNKAYHWLEYNKPTEVCQGAIYDLFTFLKDQQLNPTRLRLSALRPNSTIPMHNDAVCDTQYCMKLHIPVVTTNDCVTIMDNQEFVMEVGKVYMFNANSQHSVVNNSNSVRWHFICDVYDEKGNFSFGKCSNYKYHIDIASKWRRAVDGIDDTKYILIDQ